MTEHAQATFSLRLQDALSRYLLWNWKTIMKSIFGKEYGLLVKEPQLVFCDSATWLGRYTHGGIPKIELSRHLVLNYSWCSVRCVFYHEVAHQITSYISPGAMPHGREFREVCRRIGAMPDARVDVVALDEQLSRDGNHASGLENKLRKLMTLANHGEENEAQAALAKALELMSKYGITEDDISSDNDYVTAQLGRPMARLDMTCHQIFRILNEFWGVHGVFAYQPDLSNPERDLRIITVSGTRDKVIIALYVYDYIMNNMMLAYERARHGLSGRNSKRDFCSGFLKGIYEKLRGVAENEQVYALIHKGDAGTKAYVERHFGPLHSARSSCSLINQNAVSKGFSAGSVLDINPGVAEGGKKLLKE